MADEQQKPGLVARVAGALAQRSGQEIVEAGTSKTLEESVYTARTLQRELEDLGYSVLDYASSLPKEMRLEERLKIAQRARMAWIADAQIGGTVDLLDDFVLGRGIPRPRAKDPLVQEKVIDELWDDLDNKISLTTFDAQRALNTDLTIQANVYFVVFVGSDGKVKLSIVEHDTVIDAITDPNNRLRVLYYVAKEKKSVEWDYTSDKRKPTAGLPEAVYYEAYGAIGVDEKIKDFEAPPKDKIKPGKILHLRVNRTTEQVFGISPLYRVLRWASAYNELMKARVDMAKAQASLIMKSKVRGTPGQVAKAASQALHGHSELGVDYSAVQESDPYGHTYGPHPPAGIIYENESQTFEPLRLDSGAASATQDARLIRAQLSAGTHMPQHYLGDAETANLASATAIELSVLKPVESRQEVIEDGVRAIIKLAIDEAVKNGKIKTERTAAEVAQLKRQQAIQEVKERAGVARQDDETFEQYRDRMLVMIEAVEEKIDDDTLAERDLTFDFSMPSPLRRMLTDLVTAVTSVARSFDPNGTNMELSRYLLGLVLSEGFEAADASEIVERVFPEGYVDPMIAAAMQQQPQSQQPEQPPGPGQPTDELGNAVTPGAEQPPGDSFGVYGASTQATPAEQQPGMVEARELPTATKAKALKRAARVEEEFGEVEAVALAGLGNGASQKPKK